MKHRDESLLGPLSSGRERNLAARIMFLIRKASQSIWLWFFSRPDVYLLVCWLTIGIGVGFHRLASNRCEDWTSSPLSDQSHVVLSFPCNGSALQRTQHVLRNLLQIYAELLWDSPRPIRWVQGQIIAVIVRALALVLLPPRLYRKASPWLVVAARAVAPACLAILSLWPALELLWTRQGIAPRTLGYLSSSSNVTESDRLADVYIEFSLRWYPLMDIAINYMHPTSVLAETVYGVFSTTCVLTMGLLTLPGARLPRGFLLRQQLAKCLLSTTALLAIERWRLLQANRCGGSRNRCIRGGSSSSSSGGGSSSYCCPCSGDSNLLPLSRGRTRVASSTGGGDTIDVVKHAGGGIAGEAYDKDGMDENLLGARDSSCSDSSQAVIQDSRSVRHRRVVQQHKLPLQALQPGREHNQYDQLRRRLQVGVQLPDVVRPGTLRVTTVETRRVGGRGGASGLDPSVAQLTSQQYRNIRLRLRAVSQLDLRPSEPGAHAVEQTDVVMPAQQSQFESVFQPLAPASQTQLPPPLPPHPQGLLQLRARQLTTYKPFHKRILGNDHGLRRTALETATSRESSGGGEGGLSSLETTAHEPAEAGQLDQTGVVVLSGPVSTTRALSVPQQGMETLGIAQNSYGASERVAAAPFDPRDIYIPEQPSQQLHGHQSQRGQLSYHIPYTRRTVQYTTRVKIDGCEPDQVETGYHRRIEQVVAGAGLLLESLALREGCIELLIGTRAIGEGPGADNDGRASTPAVAVNPLAAPEYGNDYRSSGGPGSSGALSQSTALGSIPTQDLNDDVLDIGAIIRALQLPNSPLQESDMAPTSGEVFSGDSDGDCDGNGDEEHYAADAGVVTTTARQPGSSHRLISPTQVPSQSSQLRIWGDDEAGGVISDVTTAARGAWDSTDSRTAPADPWVAEGSRVNPVNALHTHHYNHMRRGPGACTSHPPVQCTVMAAAAAAMASRESLYTAPAGPMPYQLVGQPYVLDVFPRVLLVNSAPEFASSRSASAHAPLTAAAQQVEESREVGADAMPQTPQQGEQHQQRTQSDAGTSATLVMAISWVTLSTAAAVDWTAVSTPLPASPPPAPSTTAAATHPQASECVGPSVPPFAAPTVGAELQDGCQGAISPPHLPPSGDGAVKRRVTEFEDSALQAAPAHDVQEPSACFLAPLPGTAAPAAEEMNDMATPEPTPSAQIMLSFHGELVAVALVVAPAGVANPAGPQTSTATMMTTSPLVISRGVEADVDTCATAMNAARKDAAGLHQGLNAVLGKETIYSVDPRPLLAQLKPGVLLVGVRQVPRVTADVKVAAVVATADDDTAAARPGPAAVPVLLVDDPRVALELQLALDSWYGTVDEIDSMLYDIGALLRMQDDLMAYAAAWMGGGGGAGAGGGSGSSGIGVQKLNTLSARTQMLHDHILAYAEALSWDGTQSWLQARHRAVTAAVSTAIITAAQPRRAPPVEDQPIKGAADLGITAVAAVVTEPSAATTATATTTTTTTSGGSLSHHSHGGGSFAAAVRSNERWLLPRPTLIKNLSGLLMAKFLSLVNAAVVRMPIMQRLRQSATRLQPRLRLLWMVLGWRSEGLADTASYASYTHLFATNIMNVMQVMDIIGFITVMTRGLVRADGGESGGGSIFIGSACLDPDKACVLVAASTGVFMGALWLVLPRAFWRRISARAKWPRQISYTMSKMMVAFLGFPQPPATLKHELGISIFVVEGIILPAAVLMSPLESVVVGLIRAPLCARMWLLAAGSNHTVATASARALALSALNVLTTIVVHLHIRILYERQRGATHHAKCD